MATDLGKAYVQIIPSAEGISGKIQDALDPEVQKAGNSAGGGIASGIKKAIIAAGIGASITSAVSEGAALEQSIGGVETLFKDQAGVVKKYASEAYKTAGVSANEYMKNVTSFSASLLQSLGGDTKKAADVANMSMIDMADNANKMGTDMQSIQTAYQGFAKQNYTMLDNLKLGYGGTKSEMERLLADASKLSGVKYDISNLSDVYSAIHVIQKEIGITGTTATEAGQTVSGSFNAMKSAFSNLLGTMATGGNIGPALTGLGTTITTFFTNLLPMVTSVIVQIPQALITLFTEAGPGLLTAGAEAVGNILAGIGQRMPELIPAMVEGITSMISAIIENLPTLVEGGLELFKGIIQGVVDAIPLLVEKAPEIINSLMEALKALIPEIITTGVELLSSLVEELPTIIENIVAVLPEIIKSIIDTITTLLPQIVEAGVKLFTSLITNLPSIIATILTAIPKIVGDIVTAFLGLIPQIVTTGFNLLTSLITDLPSIISHLVAAMPQIISGMVGALMQGVSAFVEVGKNLIRGIWEGIKSVGSWLADQVTNFIGGIVDGIKSFFGIQSPSKLMAQEVGKFLPMGIAKGINENAASVTKAMEDLTDIATGTANADFKIKSNIGIEEGVTNYSSGSYGGLTSSEIINAISSGFSAAMNQISNVTTGEKMEVNLIVNGRELLTSVVTEARKEIIRTGVNPLTAI